MFAKDGAVISYRAAPHTDDNEELEAKVARGEVWNEVRTLFKLGAVKVVEARLFVAQDDTKPLPTAFQMLVSFRVLGAQIDSDIKTNNFAVANGDVTIPVSVSTFEGNVAGTVGNWHGTDGDGSKSTDDT